MELEQDCQRHERAVVEICEPENVIVEDVNSKRQLTRSTIHYLTLIFLSPLLIRKARKSTLNFSRL